MKHMESLTKEDLSKLIEMLKRLPKDKIVKMYLENPMDYFEISDTLKKLKLRDKIELYVGKGKRL